MEHVKALALTVAAWFGVAVSFLEKMLPVFQLVAVFLAIAASITTIRLNQHREKREAKEKAR